MSATATLDSAVATPTATLPAGNGKAKAKGKKGATKGSKPAAKATKNGKGKATPPKANGAGRPTKEGLRKPQVAILAALAKARSPLSRPEIGAASGVDASKIGDYSDQSLDRTAEAAARYPFPDLRSLGFVHVDDSGHPRRYSITARGRAALVAAQKLAAAK